MYYQIQQPQYNKFLTFAGISAGAAMVTLGSFALMDYLVGQKSADIPEKTSVPTIQVIMPEQEMETEVIKPSLPQKPEIKSIPPRNTIMNSSQDEGMDIGLDIDAELPPSNEVKPSLGMNRGAYDATPMVRMDPKYPIDALRDGVEGWVKLRFDIDQLGNVVNVHIIDSQPNRIFDKEAKRALKKWKYRPAANAGAAVQMTGLEVQLDFTMSQ